MLDFYYFLFSTMPWLQPAPDAVLQSSELNARRELGRGEVLPNWSKHLLKYKFAFFLKYSELHLDTYSI